MALKTTTWKERNIDNLELTLSFAIQKGISEPHILDFGPGGSVYFMARYLTSGRASDLSRREKIIRVSESFLRKTGLFRLVTNEPKEIVSVFQSLSPKKLTVYDREKKVIRAVLDLAESGEIAVALEAIVKDIESGPIENEGDIVIALNIVSRTNDKATALSNIMSTVRPGGLFCININDAPTGFKKLGHCLFERLV